MPRNKMRHLEEARHAIAERLPQKASWVVAHMSADYDFSTDKFGLSPVSKANFFLAGEPMPEEWKKLRKFGEVDYCDGGGARPLLTISEDTGEVYGLDIEREGRELYVLNSSIHQFFAVFDLLDPYLSKEQELPLNILDQIRNVDPNCYERSDWKELVEYIVEKDR